MPKQLEILYVTPNAPWPTSTGSAQRSNLLWTALNQMGNINLLCLQSPESLGEEACDLLHNKFGLKGISARSSQADAAPWKYLAQYHGPTAARLGNFFDASKSRYLPDVALINRLNTNSLSNKIDIVVGRYLHSAACLGYLDSNIPTFVDIDDLDSAALRSQAASIGTSKIDRWLAERHLKNINKSEQLSIEKASALWVANPDDIAKPGLENADYLPNIPFLGEGENWNSKPPSKSATIGCLASYGHAPNVEAIDWFLKQVWPIILASQPEAQFNIYGSQLSESLRQRWSTDARNVNIIGFIDHVQDAYEAMTLAICPVQRGAGTNIKVLEAGFHNRICVVTESASRGILTTDKLKRSVPVCSSAENMSETILKYLNNSTKLLHDTEQYTVSIRESYSKEAFNNAVISTIEKTLSGTQVAS